MEVHVENNNQGASLASLHVTVLMAQAVLI